MIALNLGSGQRKFHGWINVDIQPKWSPDIVSDIKSMPMFKDDYADVIVLHHVYEHFGLGELDQCVSECYRILKPGGILIVTCPDLKALVEGWRNGKINDYIFCVQLYGAYMGDEADRHKWGYTGKTLSESLCKAANWRSTMSFDWRQIDGADIAKDWYILGVEAVK